jgi:hypothetical protein
MSRGIVSQFDWKPGIIYQKEATLRAADLSVRDPDDRVAAKLT